MATLGPADGDDDPAPHRSLACPTDFTILAMLATLAVAALLIVLL